MNETSVRTGHRLPRGIILAGFLFVVAAQAFLGFLGVDDDWTRGHNGWNSSAYSLSARNSLRFELLFPLQYHMGVTPPNPDEVYTHHPLAMHLHNVASVWLFGDRPGAVRGVAAFHAVLAVIMLFVVVRRWYGDVHAMLASAIFVVLPINAIFLNMANHSSGFFFWGLLALYAYLRMQEEARSETLDRDRRSLRLLILMFGAFFLAAQWDWPAYYVAFAIAVHWGVTVLVRLFQTRSWRGTREVRPLGLVAFSVFVLATFAGHFLLVHLVTTNIGELESTFHARLDVSREAFLQHLKVVPELMFTSPVLVMCGVFLVGYLVRLVRRRAEARDLVPITFAYGGALHYVLFRWSAIVHEYWAWTALPFVAIATASVVIALGRALRNGTERRAPHRPMLAYAFSFAGLVLLVPLVARSVDLVPKGRRVGGSMWFVAPTRGETIAPYDSGRRELTFAREVGRRTSRATGVLVHTSIDALVPEPRFFITLDREVQRVHGISLRPPERAGITEGWVLIGVVDRVARPVLARAARQYAYVQFGEFFLLDLRRPAPAIEAYVLAPGPGSASHWYFRSPFEPPLVGHRLPELEAKLKAEFGTGESFPDGTRTTASGSN